MIALPRLFVLACLLIAPARATDIHVFSGEDLQAALDSAVAGDTVLVHPGTYTATTSFDFQGKAIRVASTDGPAATTLTTGASPASVVYFHTAETNDSILEGFTVTGGTGTAFGIAYLGGGGIHCQQGASPTIRRCRITGNSIATGAWTRVGGGVAAFGGAPLLEECLVANNDADHGGGVGGENPVDPHIVRLVRCVIRDNQADLGGGAYGSFSALETTFRENAAIDGGGAWLPGVVAAECEYCSFILRCRFIANAADLGGGLFVASTQSDGPHGSIFLENVATSRGGGICFEKFAPPPSSVVFTSECAYGGNQSPLGAAINVNAVGSHSQSVFIQNSSFVDHASGTLIECVGGLSRLTNSIVRNLGGTLFGGSGFLITSYSNVEGGTPGTGNVDVDPLFVDAAAHDCHIRYSSPMIDQPDPLIIPTAFDFDGDTRKLGASTDLGPDEFAPRLYLRGDPARGAVLTATIVGQPSAGTALLFVSGNQLPSGVPAPPYGTFHLTSPFFAIVLGPLPATGALPLSATLPVTIPAGTHVALQAFTGAVLTNALTFEVW